MTTIRSHLMAAALLVGLTTVPTTPGFSQARTKVGILNCQTTVRLGLIIASRQKLRCQFTPDHGGSPQNYVAHVVHVGPELGLSAEGVMTFEVFASTTALPHGALAGVHRHRTHSGSVAPGFGVGDKAIVGAGHQPIALEPLPVAGVNLAVAVEALRLRSVR